MILLFDYFLSVSVNLHNEGGAHSISRRPLEKWLKFPKEEGVLLRITT